MQVRIHESGFTMAELMVSVVILAIVTTGVLGVFTAQHQTYVRQERVLEVQQDARLVIQMMRADVRLGGFLVPTFTGIAGIDGGTAGTDVLCTSDPSVIAEAEIDQALGPFPGASLVSALLAAATSVTLATASMDIDSDGDTDFGLGAGIIVSDGSDTHCARITDVTGNVVTFTPATPAGFSVAAGAGRAAPSVIYEITGGGLRRNLVLLSTQVENVQVEYGIDLDDDGDIEGAEFPIDDMTGSDPALIRGVRIHVITRTPSEDPDFRGSGMPAAANHVAGAPDGFLRRRFSANVVAQNL